MRKSRLVILLLVVTLLLGLVGGAAGQDNKKSVVWHVAAPLTLDPSLATTSGDDQVVESLGVGLLRVNQVTFEVEPGMATSWDTSDDLSTYTFHMLQNVPWVRYSPDTDEVEQVTDENGNVRIVTANDFAYGIRRTLDPRTASENASVLASWIVGGQELLESGDATDEELDALIAKLGVEVVDDYTLKLTSPQGSPLALWTYSLSVMMAQPSWIIKDVGEDLWATVDYIQSFGPFALKHLEPDQYYLLVRNPFWPGTESVPVPKLDEVKVVHIGFENFVSAFEVGEVDGFEEAAPPQEVARAQANPELREQMAAVPSKIVQIVGFNVLKPPFDDVRVRRAFSMAIDRQSLIDNVLAGGGLPAATFTIPTIAAAPSPDLYPDIGIHYDPEGAKALLQEYLDEKGITADQLNVTVMYNTVEYIALIFQALQQMWAETLGVNVELASQEWAVYNDLVHVDAPAVFRYYGTWDYPDADSMLYGVFHSESLLNFTNWSNPTFDQLVEEARFEPDVAKRRDLYAQAEQILVYDDAAIVPIFYGVIYSFTKPWVIRDVTGGLLQRFELWDTQR